MPGTAILTLAELVAQVEATKTVEASAAVAIDAALANGATAEELAQCKRRWMEQGGDPNR